MALAVPASRAVSSSANFTTARPSLTGLGTQLTAHATPHSLPSPPTELIAATVVEGEWLYVFIHNMAVSATLTDALVNIYIGGAGSETLLIDSLLAGWSNTLVLGGGPAHYWFPLRIPRGTRISAALRALITVDVCTVYVAVGNSNGAHWVGSGVETLGAVTGSSKGTAITAGGASEGAWTSIASSGRRYRYLNMGAMSNNDTSIVAEGIAWDVGVGSAVYQGMEGEMFSVNNSSESMQMFESAGLWCDIPSGTALQLRGQSHTAPSGATTACLYGVY